MLRSFILRVPYFESPQVSHQHIESLDSQVSQAMITKAKPRDVVMASQAHWAKQGQPVAWLPLPDKELDHGTTMPGIPVAVRL